ncbi:hypothetical protein [uncultured Chitinophaga sp.]|uniref:hypothetical protein n=1 Tax=uncultured Chitinophaga sp. TaxID=339340 RepID=UPI0025D22EED|nr:hypothetical protein [uncultured Chitinophaga sp.]
MAISTNVMLLALSGTIANQLTVKNYGGKAVICKKIGKREKKGTDKQLDNEYTFKIANEVVKERYADLAQREAARVRLQVPYGKNLYRAMLKEYYSELE